MRAFEAAVAMLVQMLASVLLTQAEARDRAALAAALNAVRWPAAIWCTALCVAALQPPASPGKDVVVGAVWAAAVGGTYVAVRIGRKAIKRRGAGHDGRPKDRSAHDHRDVSP